MGLVTILKKVVGIGKTGATKAASVSKTVAADTLKVVTSDAKVVGTKAAKGAVKGGVAIGAVTGAAAGWSLSRQSIDTNGDGNPDMDPIVYLLSLPSRFAESVSQHSGTIAVCLIAGVAVLVLASRDNK